MAQKKTTINSQIKELKSSPQTRVVIPLTQKKAPKDRRRIYDMFAAHGLHLTEHYLGIIYGYFRDASRPTVAKACKKYTKINGCTDPARGVYNTSENKKRYLAAVRKPVVAKNLVTGEEKLYPSIYRAAMQDFGGKFANISQALGRVNGIHAGHQWRYA